MSSSCEMCGRNGTRCTSRGCVWPTVSGWSRPTHQKTIQSRRVSRRHVVELRNVWQEWDALHIARVRLAERKRDIASCLAKSNTKSTCFLPTWTFLSSTLRNAQQEWDAAHIARGRMASPKRDLPSYLRQKRGAADIARGMFLVDVAQCAAGIGRGACRALYVQPPTM